MIVLIGTYSLYFC